jgi:hypothetical protein
MARIKLPYSEGTVFVLPLRKGGFARGVVARMDGKGGILGYFYGPKYQSIGEANQIKDISPLNTIFRGIFGDPGLINGEWTIIGQIENWNREKWPMPLFIRTDELSKKAWLSEYDENTFKCVSETKVDPIYKSRYPEDGSWGYGAIEIHLTKLL